MKLLLRLNLLALLLWGTACEETTRSGSGGDWHTDRGQTNHHAVSTDTFPSQFAQQWSHAGGDPWQGSLTLAQGNLYAGNAAGEMVAMSPADGSPQWSEGLGSWVSMAATGYTFGGTALLLATAESGKAAALDPANGNPIWSISTDATWISAFNHDSEKAYYVHTLNCDTITIIDLSMAQGGSIDPVYEAVLNAQVLSPIWKTLMAKNQKWMMTQMKKAREYFGEQELERLYLIAKMDPETKKVSLNLGDGKQYFTMDQSSAQDTITIIDMQTPQDTITIIDMCYKTREAGSCTRLRAVTPGTGAVLWNSDPIPLSTATPLVTTQGIGLAMRSKNTTYALFNQGTGEVIWVYGEGSPSGGSVDSGVWDTGNGEEGSSLIYINPRSGDAENPANVIALKANDGSLVWDQSLPHNGYVIGFAKKENRLIAAQNGHLYCLDLSANGNILWSHHYNPNYIDPCTYRGPQPVIWGDKVIMVTDQNILTVLELSNGAVHSTHNLDSQVRATPAISGGTLYVATAVGTVYGFGN